MVIVTSFILVTLVGLMPSLGNPKKPHKLESDQEPILTQSTASYDDLNTHLLLAQCEAMGMPIPKPPLSSKANEYLDRRKKLLRC